MSRLFHETLTQGIEFVKSFALLVSGSSSGGYFLGLELCDSLEVFDASFVGSFVEFLGNESSNYEEEWFQAHGDKDHFDP